MPSPRFSGEREGPGAQRREGEGRADLVPKTFEKRTPSRVTLYFFIGRMGCAVYFDDEHGFAANEISDIAANRTLPDEFEAIELTIAQLSPKPRFGTG